MTAVPDLHEAFETIKQLYRDAFGVQTVLMKSLDGYENTLDFGIRRIIWPDFRFETPAEFPSRVDQRSILLTHSNLGFYNMVVYVSTGDNPECVGIGPFRDEEMDDNAFVNLAAKWELSADNMSSIRQLYHSMPLISVPQISNFTLHLFSYFFPEINDIPVRHISYSASNRKVQPNVDLITDYAIEYGEQYQIKYKQFLQALDKGDFRSAWSAMKSIMEHTGLINEHDVHRYKNYLISLNSMCHEHLLMMGSIHPTNLLVMMQSLNQQIDTFPRSEDLSVMLLQIVREYCQLVASHSYDGYSFMVRSSIQYIMLHYAEELSLDVVADALDKNPAYLSRLFHTETGKTLTDFIHETRIQEAKRLFESTELSIGEVASAVGIHDYSYFAKLFRKITGISPRDYRRGVRESQPKVYKKPPLQG